MSKQTNDNAKAWRDRKRALGLCINCGKKKAWHFDGKDYVRCIRCLTTNADNRRDAEERKKNEREAKDLERQKACFKSLY